MPFVLFFEGLARAEATQASFIQKTLVVWVALLAVPLLHERFGWPHALAIVLLVAGQAWLVGDAGTVAFGQGEAMILVATLLWAVEVVFVKYLLRGLSPSLLAAARMGFGAALLLAWVAVSGRWGGSRASAPSSGAGCSSPGCCSPPTSPPGTRRSRGRRRSTSRRCSSSARSSPRLLSGAIDGKTVSAAGMALVAAGSVIVAVAALRRPVAGALDLVTATAGPLLFARYAYPPNALGLCGADVRRTLIEYGAARESDGGLAELARTFEGAWPYLELIAGSNGIADPLDPRVVEAYWVGNELLDRVEPGSLARHVDDRFRGRLGRARENVVDAVAAGAVPHHCFHVFAVYPWLGLLRSGIVDEPLRILDQCRTTPARVLAVDGETVTVLARPLLYEGGQLRLGAPARAVGPLERRRARVRRRARARRPRLAALGLRLRRVDTARGAHARARHAACALRRQWPRARDGRSRSRGAGAPLGAGLRLDPRRSLTSGRVISRAGGPVRWKIGRIVLPPWRARLAGMRRCSNRERKRVQRAGRV